MDMSVQSVLQQLIRNVSMRSAVAGDGDGHVAVAGRPNYVYARLGGADGDVVEVHCGVLLPTDGGVILVARDTGGNLAQWRVVFKL